MPFLIIIIALITLAICWQVYRLSNSRMNGTLINVIIIGTVVIVSLSLLDISTAPTNAQDSATNIPILDATIVQSTNVNDTINATGAIVPSKDVSLAFQYSSPVIEVLVEVGDVVEEGQVLARLDSDDIQQNFEIAVFNAENQQINLDELLGDPRDVDLVAAEAALQAAQLNFGGSSVLTGEGSTQAEIQRIQLELSKNRMWQTALRRDNALEQVVSTGYNLETADFGDTEINIFGNTITFPGQDEGQAQDNYNASLQNLWSLEGSLGSAEASTAFAEGQYQAELIRPPRYGGSPGASLQRTQAQQRLDNLLFGPDEENIQFTQIDLALANFRLSQAELQLDYVELVAPFSGVITEVNLTVGEIPPAFGAIMMMDNSQFKVNMDIDEIDIMQIQVGQDVNFVVDALPDDEIMGMVEHVSLTPNQNTQVVSYNVRVLLDETDAPIRAGMSTTGQIVTMSVADVLAVPERFIFRDTVTGKPYVIVQNPGGGLQRVTIEEGARGGNLAEIQGGITPGQQVVLVSSENIEQIPYRGNTNG